MRTERARQIQQQTAYTKALFTTDQQDKPSDPYELHHEKLIKQGFNNIFKKQKIDQRNSKHSKILNFFKKKLWYHHKKKPKQESKAQPKSSGKKPLKSNRPI